MVSRLETRIGRSTSRSEWMRWALPLAGAALLALAVASSSGAAHAATYKWVDEKGVIHYTDKMPPEEMNKGRIELNKQGVPVKATEPAPTPEQRRAMALEEQRQKEIAKQQDDQARRDRALLSSYTSESEIDLARNRSLRTIESVVDPYTGGLSPLRACFEQAALLSDYAAMKKSVYENQAIPSALVTPASRCRHPWNASSRASMRSSRVRTS